MKDKMPLYLKRQFSTLKLATMRNNTERYLAIKSDDIYQGNKPQELLVSNPRKCSTLFFISVSKCVFSLFVYSILTVMLILLFEKQNP